MSARTDPERGSVSIVAAGMLLLVLVLTLGVADAARVLASAGRARTAADAAALAAAQQLALPDGRAPSDLAGEYAARNDAALVYCACEQGAVDATVRVLVGVGPLFLFSDDRSVGRSARAEVVLPADP
ncbi:MAG: Rv3654c family TadE-like protein [Actinomycetota bacterium]